MAKFKWTDVPGYKDGMTDAEKLELLSGFDIPEATDLTKFVKKDQFDKLSSDYAALKKEQREKMTEAEKEQADRAAEMEQMRVQLEGFKRDKTLSDNKAKLLAQGFSAELAAKAAEALTDGNNDALFEAMAQHRAETEKAFQAQGLRSTPTPPAGGTPETKEAQDEALLRKQWGLPPEKI